MPEHTRAGQYLRELRAASGLTQQQTAQLSGVHVRTIRGLETGRITKPRRPTLDLLGRALGLDVSAQMRFLELWGVADVGPVTGEQPSTMRASSELETVLNQRAAQSAAVSIWEHIVIDEHRRLATRRTEEAIVALAPATTQRSVVYDPDDPLIDIDGVHLEDVENGHVVREQVDRERRCKIFSVSLGRSLAVGQSHILRYSMKFPPLRDAATAPITRDQVIGGFVRSPASYVLEVHFSWGAPAPLSCIQIFQARPTGPVHHVADLPLSGDRTAYLTLLNPKPGGHGIAWQW